MKKQELVDKTQETCAEITKTLNFILSLTDGYINSFETEYFFSFSDTAKRIKKLKKSYGEFLVALSEPLNKLECEMAGISTLLIIADIQMDSDMIIFLQSLFEEYLRFEKNLSDYGVAVKKEFEEKSTSPSLLLTEAKKFKFSLLALLKKTN